MRCLTDLLSPNSTMLWSLPPHTDVCVYAYRRVLFLVFFNLCGQILICLSKVGGNTSTKRQIVNHIGFQVTVERRHKGGNSGFRFPVRKHNLCVDDAPHLVCKRLTLISLILKQEHWGFLVSFVICCPNFRFSW